MDKLIERNLFLRKTLQDLLKENQPNCDPGKRKKVDLIITPNEVNWCHGTGTLLINIFKQCSNVFSLRLHNTYGGKQDFGKQKIMLSLDNCSRANVYGKILDVFKEYKPRRVLCVPYTWKDVLAAITIKNIFNVPLCSYIMDDNCIYSSSADRIPIDMMTEFLKKSDLRLAISPELRIAYERQFRLKFWILPPVVNHSLIEKRVTVPPPSNKAKGILVGNIWSPRYLEHLKEMIKQTDTRIDWYYNNSDNHYLLSPDLDELEKSGITVYKPLPENELSKILKNYAYALVPSGMLNDDDDRENISRLSLPSRIPFIMATSQTPVLVLGSKSTSAARFVELFRIGTVCNYESVDFMEALKAITGNEHQYIMRRNAHKAAPSFSSQKVSDWIWQSLKSGQPIDSRYEELFSVDPAEIVYYIEPPAPKTIHIDFVPVYQVLNRIKMKGFIPGFIVDVGASTGIWSDTANYVFPDVDYLLIDPLFSLYDPKSIEHHINRHDNFSILEAIVTNEVCEQVIHVTEALYNSSILDDNFGTAKAMTTKAVTLDSLLENYSFSGRGIIKLDIQFAEHLAIEGGKKFFELIDICIMEISLWKTNHSTKDLLEMLEIMNDIGFRYFDDIGEWRTPKEGILFQKDIVFARKKLF